MKYPGSLPYAQLCPFDFEAAARGLIFFIEALVYDFDEARQLLEDKKTGGWIELTARGDYSDIFSSIAEANIRCL